MGNIKFSNRHTMQILRKGSGLQQNETKIEKQINPFVIKKNTSNIVRLNLKWDDIFNNGLIERGVVDEVFFNGKKIYLFRYPYFIPEFRQYYACKVESPNNYYLTELIEMLLFLNPNPDCLMKKKITECILQKFTLHIKTESKVKIGSFTTMPVLTFEEIYLLVDTMTKINNNKSYKPPHKETVMYGESYFTKSEKISLKANLRNINACKHYKSAIYDAIQVLIKINPDVKISYASLEKIEVIKKFGSDTYASAKLIGSIITEENKIIIEKHNERAIFNSEIKKEKYNKFSLMVNPTLDNIVANCYVSRRDAKEFKKIKRSLAYNI